MFWRQKRIKILFCRQNIANTADAFATSGLEIRWKLFFKSPWAWRMLNQRLNSNNDTFDSGKNPVET